MIHLQFPPIHKLLEKDLTGYEENDARRGVVIIKDHAVVMNKRSIVCFNLHEYFTIKEKKQTAEQIADLNKILQFMDGKQFSGAFWEELCRGAVVYVKEGINDNKLHLEGAVKKDLIHDYKKVDTTPILEILGKNSEANMVSLNKVTYFVEPLSDILTVFKKYLKKESMVLEFTGVNSTIRFTFEDNPWIFGVFDSDNALSNKSFLFENLSSFYLDATV